MAQLGEATAKQGALESLQPEEAASTPVRGRHGVACTQKGIQKRIGAQRRQDPAPPGLALHRETAWPRGEPSSQAIPPQASATAGHSLFNAVLQPPCKADAFVPFLQMKKQKLRDVM